MASSSSSRSGTAEQLARPDYRNWLALGHALTTVFCRGIRPFVGREMESFYRNLKLTVKGPCMCVYSPRRRPNEYHDMSTCPWANIIEACHHRKRPNWKQSDSKNWMDPVLGPWEIAKLFLPDLGGRADIKSADDMDITGILNLMYWCNHFTVPHSLINDVRETRNDKWVHVPKLELSDADKKTAFDTIENLLKDPQLAADTDVQKCLKEITDLKHVFDLHSFEAQVLADFKEVLTRQSKKRQREVNQLKQQVSVLEKRLKVIEKSKGFLSPLRVILKGIENIHDRLVGSVKAIRKGLIVWLLIAILCSLCHVLDDDTFVREGCPTEDLRVPFDTKEFDWLDYLSAAKETFTGRSWLYSELEDVFSYSNDSTGVLIIGDPGTGKSALFAQLVCSQTSSRTINSLVLGYHLCKHSDKNTQIAGKFVRNLAEMIARRLPEYGYTVANSTQIQRSLNTDCVDIHDPVGCFEQSILTPLRRLKNEPREKWFLAVDALDECLSHSDTNDSIIYLLKQKLPRFPTWLKLIMTSRNESSILFNFRSVKRIIIEPEDTRNLDDIERFLEARFYQDGPMIRKLKMWFGDDSIENTERLISALLSKSQGNFLFVKEMVRHWESSKQAQSDPYALPRSLGELYQSFFERLYNQEKFKPFKRILEILVSTFEPLTEKQIFHVLNITMKEAHLTDFENRFTELRHFLRYGKNGTLTLYHFSLIEWLTGESNRNGPFYISKKRGHELFCDYYFNLIRKGDNLTLSTHIPNLVQHIAIAGWNERYLGEFLSFPSQVVNSSDPSSKRTLLHLVATINNSDVLKLVLRHFQSIDSIDDRGITPAFLAAKHGLVENLALLVGGGANVNRKTNSLASFLKDIHNSNIVDFNRFLILKSKYEFWGSTMLHVSAHKGHLCVVKFLLNNSAAISAANEVHMTALQLAAENGHLEVVKVLTEAGAVADQTALHHAAKNNRLEVVKYLLQIGVKDECMRCDGSFYWLNSKHRFHRKLSHFKDDTITKKRGCPEDRTLEGTYFGLKTVLLLPSNSDEMGELYDDRHLIFCETALHAAVSSGHNSIVTELLSSDARALGCHDYSGRTPLHAAVRENNHDILEVLLKAHETVLNITCSFWQDVQEKRGQNDSRMLDDIELFEYHKDVCHCGYTPLHLAARYGHTKIGMRLIDSGAHVNARDCQGATPLHVAACHNHVQFAHHLLAAARADLNSRTLNGSKPIHSAAACSAIDVINLLRYLRANLSATDDNGLTALHHTILTIHSKDLDKFVFSNMTSSDNPRILIESHYRYAEIYQDSGGNINNNKGYEWLNSLFYLILVGSDINATDTQGRTALHIAAENGLFDAVSVLLQKKANPNIRDKFGKTPLEAALDNATSGLPSILLESSFDNLVTVSRPFTAHDYVVYLLLASGSTFNSCQPSGNLLHRAIMKGQGNIARLLLLKGASPTCQDSLGRTPTVAYLNNGRNWMDVIFRDVLKNAVSIKCGEPFNFSVFHLLCYRSLSKSYSDFLQRLCSDHNRSSFKSPITLAIEGYFSKYKQSIDSCLDAEGFTPLHRAAQGANIVAVRNLIKQGANVSLLSPHGHDALTLAVLHVGSNLWRFFNDNESLETIGEVSDVALELLHHKMNTSDFKIVCDRNKAELTLYHLAASRGLVHLIKEVFRNKNLHQLDVDCPNRDGITPMYLAKILSNKVSDDVYNPWEEVVQFIKSQGGRMQYPKRSAEYMVIYNRMYGWIPKEIDMSIRPDIRGFVVGLLSTYRYWQNKSVRCDLPEINEKNMAIGSPISTLRIASELLRQLKLLSYEGFYSRLVSFALEDLKVCRKKYKGPSLWSTFNRHKKSLRLFNQWNLDIRLERGLFFLMRMWHEEVFRHYSCIKIVFDRYQPYFINERISKLLIKRYEESTPLKFFNIACFLFEITFKAHILHYTLDIEYVPFRGLHHKYPNFVRQRMGWTEDVITYNSWPLEFLFKFPLGMYREYYYVKVLNVGLEPKTYISLHSEKHEQLLSQVKQALRKQALRK
ncbi:uncharacterized protein LOC111344986 [Stylophora pistillata]|uniref:uncharacterized protein LOC111344986 n=1 Tax=Stylophora pistillata TaxID=50429 RepID=UPI000C039CFA|nr:uncharacterized protein LOC111344986 [Stylophora pistillata]